MLDPLTIVLMLGAGLLHASWHALIKSGDNQVVLLAGMGLVAGVAAVCALPLVTLPAAEVWVVIGVSVVLHVGYKLALARAYAMGDLSQALPLSRGLVPFLATAIAFGLLGQLPGPAQIGGICIVSVGLICLAYDAMRGGIDRRVFVAAFAAGSTVAGYSALDAYGIRLAGDWFSFALLLVIVDSFSFALLAHLMQPRDLWQQMKAERGRILVSGLLGLFSYGVFLWALGRAPVGLVAALRESSVLFAALLGMLFLGERASLHRVGAAVLITAGLVVIAAAR